MARKNRADNAAPGKGAATTSKPKKDGRFRQMWAVFQMTRKHDRTLVWWMAGITVVVLAAAILVGMFVPLVPLFYSIFMGILIAIVGCMFVLARKAEKAAYSQIEGKPGAVSSALGTIRRRWNIEEQPVAVDPRTQDMVFRATGRAGVVLISEGPHHRVTKLLTKEEKRVARVLPNVPIHRYECGNEEGQVPLRRIATKVQRTRVAKGENYLTKAETAEVYHRLRALSAVPPLGIPKGIDPLKARPDRKGLRGR